MDRISPHPPPAPALTPAEVIMKLEADLGRLSPVQKMLIGTDGSVTNLLEVVTNNPIEIETLEQRVVPADGGVAEELAINPGEPVNYRVVVLKNLAAGRL